MPEPLVALRKESVDRNPLDNVADGGPIVALRKESVDRNVQNYNIGVGAGKVALRKESVDRNNISNTEMNKQKRSLSARRAWIEILS